MARTEEQKEAAALANLTPNAITVNVDGHDVRVASSESENRTMNQIVASQMRFLLQQAIKKFNDMEDPLSPKELRDLAEAAKNVAAFSAEVYAKGDAPSVPNAPKIVAEESGPDLSSLTRKQDIEVSTSNG